MRRSFVFSSVFAALLLNGAVSPAIAVSFGDLDCPGPPEIVEDAFLHVFTLHADGGDRLEDDGAIGETESVIMVDPRMAQHIRVTWGVATDEAHSEQVALSEDAPGDRWSRAVSGRWKMQIGSRWMN